MTPPSSGEKPPGLRRVPTDPKIVDETPEAEVLARGRFDRPGARRATMPEMAAVKLPGAPELPAEHAATIPAAAHTAATQRAQTPVSLGTVAPETPVSGRAAAREGLLERELAKVRAEKAELERRERIREEATGPGPYQSPVASTAAPAAPATTGRQGERGEQGKPSSVLAQVAAIILATTGLVTAVAAMLKPAPDTKAAESYAAIREELVKQNAAIAKNGADDELRWNFTVGLFKATGDVKVTEAPGSPKIAPLAVAPAPLTNKVSPGSAPAIQIRDTLPPPVPSVAPVRLPITLESLKAQGP